ncbi:MULTISPECIES: helix-turn-helix domain-containing protein [unclassified Streptomyces]|uniref:GbsR/MarR family transcriptional regulator n=1 Tax=unclassified Streptomyces TaxID=2593676 RepID=UPI000373DFD3|nr:MULTISPECIES: helix-turn-helix domain-containing protein [unclassified Streptomyces]MYT29586.1 helix-turn-helix domain-containing protein [Streptomyces sp. SID8354]
MPGKRLTYEERQRVAEGMAARLPYAEIARRLGRSKSTIVREVARNGGARAYQAGRAQQATKWRARRRPPARQSATPVPVPQEDTPMDRRVFEEEFTDMMVRTGVPTMAARALVPLFTSEAGGLTAAELVSRLRVSPASVSKAVGWLEQRGLIVREREGRRDRYVIDDQVWYQAWSISVQSMAAWAHFTQRGAELFGADTQSGTRLQTTSRFFRLLGDDMAQAAEHWRQALSAGR